MVDSVTVEAKRAVVRRPVKRASQGLGEALRVRVAEEDALAMLWNTNQALVAQRLMEAHPHTVNLKGRFVLSVYNPACAVDRD
jgi:hypothetical protein